MHILRLIRAALGFLAATFGVGLLLGGVFAEDLATASTQIAGGVVALGVSLGLYRSLGSRQSSPRS